MALQVKQTSGSCSMTIFCLSAILDRQGLMVAAPVDLRTFSPQALEGFRSTIKKKKNPKIVVMSPSVFTEYTNQKEVIWQQYRLCLAIAEFPVLGGKHVLILGPKSGKIWWLEKVHYLQKKSITSNGPSFVAKKPS